MPVKLNHYWTIIPSKNLEYKKFVIKEFIPRINKLGLHTVAGWQVLVGAYSEIIFETVTNDLELLEKALRNPEYKHLNSQLMNYVKSYKTKVLIKTGKKDSYSTDIKEETVKFNQMWNVVSEYQEEYDRFTVEEFFPTLEQLGISIANEWLVLIGDGPHIICEGRAVNINSLVMNLQSEKFRKVKRKLKNYVENYQSRLLSFHIQKVRGYKSVSYNVITD